MIDKIIKSLLNNYDEWEVGLRFQPDCPTWVDYFYHPKGIKLHWSHMEFDNHISVYFINKDRKETEINYHKGEQEKLFNAFQEASKKHAAKMTEHKEAARKKLEEIANTL
jgi:hypothetical protein